MSERFTIRLATPEDVDAIAEHRARMFQEMGEVSPDTFEILRAKGGNGIAEGRHAIILNVFTEPDWRRQGVAVRLLQTIIDWARAERLDRLVLHASEAGRSLYARLGFVGTNEMRLAGN